MKKLFLKLVSYIENEDVKGLLRYCLILLPFVVGVAWALGALISYATAHQEVLVILGIAACMIFPAFLGKKQMPPSTSNSVSNTNVAYFDRILLRGLYAIFTSFARQFQVIPPSKFIDLHDDLASGYDCGKNANIYRFKIVSDGEALDPALFHELLTTYLEEKLANGEIALGKSTVEFNNRLFPKIFVDECLHASGIWHISILICDNENTANYIANKRQTLIMRCSPVALQYEDGDF